MFEGIAAAGAAGGGKEAPAGKGKEEETEESLVGDVICCRPAAAATADHKSTMDWGTVAAEVRAVTSEIGTHAPLRLSSSWRKRIYAMKSSCSRSGEEVQPSRLSLAQASKGDSAW